MNQMEKMLEKAGSPPSLADELAKLAKLKEQGAITEAECQQLKQQLMKRIT